MFVQEYNPYDSDIGELHPCNFQENPALCAVCNDTRCHLHPLRPFNEIAIDLFWQRYFEDNHIEVPF